MNNKTYQPKQKEVKREWRLVDAHGQILGRLATSVAMMLTGKNKVSYSAHMDCGDYVVVVNAKDIELTGKKIQQKKYYRHSGYPGGFKEIKLSKLIVERPAKVIELAVSGMVPDNRLKKPRLARLKVFSGTEHPYADKLKKQDLPANKAGDKKEIK